MTAQVFARILPPQIIEKISIYQYNKKDSEFIVRWMIALSQQPNPNYTFWKFLIRDSENLII